MCRLSDQNGQALFEFVAVSTVCGIGAALGLTLFKLALDRQECAYQTFQETRAALNTTHLDRKKIPGPSFWTGTQVTVERDSVLGSRICGARTESVRLPLIPQKSATIMDPRVFRSLFSSSSSDPAP